MSYPLALNDMAPESAHRRHLAERLRTVQKGGLNNTLDVTVTPSAATTTITDARVVPGTCVSAAALTANAKDDVVAGLWFEPGVGSLVIHHRNNAATGRTLRLAFMG